MTDDVKAGLVLPTEMTTAMREVLGRPNFACCKPALTLRRMGYVIPENAEAEQAAVLFYLLPFAIRYGDDWLTYARVAMEQATVHLPLAASGTAGSPAGG